MKKNSGLISIILNINLAEIIVVFAVLSIIAAMIVPFTSGFIRKANEAADQANARMVFIAIQMAASDPGIDWPNGTIQYSPYDDGVSPAQLDEYIGSEWPLPMQDEAISFTVEITVEDGIVQSTSIYRISESITERFDEYTNQFLFDSTN